MKKLRIVCVTCGITAMAVSQAQAGPSSPYYMADGVNLWTVVGTNSNSSAEQTGSEYNIAVSGDIRTSGERGTGNGNQYNLGMGFTGTSYTGTWGGLFDGTTDGTHNFSLDWDTGNVMMFDRNWQGGSTLFNLGGAGTYLGITYDGSGGLWVSQWAGTLVQHYTMGGTLLGGFDAGFSSITALAMDYQTGTLWMGSQSHDGQFDQFTTGGQHLQTIVYQNMLGSNTLGGEFNLAATPEPTSIVALGLGALVLIRRKRASK